MKYSITGEPMPVVTCELEDGESMITECGSMSWMSSNMKMQTNTGGLGKVFGKMFTGEAIFRNVYTAQGGPGLIAFASSFPGAIRAIRITPSEPVVCQKTAFLAYTPGVELSVFFQKKLRAGFFGGEGFIMQKLSGEGIAFVEIDGSATEMELASGESMIVDTGYLAMMSASCTMDVQSVKGVKNVFFGGESFFNTKVTGPGKIILQSMPLNVFAGTIAACLPQKEN